MSHTRSRQTARRPVRRGPSTAKILLLVALIVVPFLGLVGVGADVFVQSKRVEQMKYRVNYASDRVRDTSRWNDRDKELDEQAVAEASYEVACTNPRWFWRDHQRCEEEVGVLRKKLAAKYPSSRR